MKFSKKTIGSEFGFSIPIPWNEELFHKIGLSRYSEQIKVVPRNGNSCSVRCSGYTQGKLLKKTEVFLYNDYLFHEMEQKAKELGATRIDLMVWEFNESAQELYRSLCMTPQRYILEKLL